MPRSSEQLRDDALAIWRAGVAAVDSARLVRDVLQVKGSTLVVGDEPLSLDDYERIVVVGAGKAGAGMAGGVEQVLGDHWLREKQVTGWVNVPADCVRRLHSIHLHAARPAGMNEPTEEGAAGANRILDLVQSLGPRDLCLCLLSGGASALLPAPHAGITLADKQAITRHLSASGANIQELNTVRKQLSRIKGGRLARACRAGRLITLIISDVLGDPLDVIGSGPTVPDESRPADALRVLERFGTRAAGLAPALFEVLERSARDDAHDAPMAAHTTNLVIGNNATAVDAAGEEAERRGYSHVMLASRQLEGPAEDIGRHHAQMAWRMRHEPGPDCLITGGEPTVQLVEAATRGKGGRNQQLVLAALLELSGSPIPPASAQRTTASGGNPLDGIMLLSGGTDGEDGPTDAAGAWIDGGIYEAWRRTTLDPARHLRTNDAYHFFEPLRGLLKTGPTHTNVCDLRVVVTSRDVDDSAHG